MSDPAQRHILVVGAGAWGSALAIHCARAGHRVTLWARSPGPIAAARVSPRLPDVRLPEGVAVSGTMPPAADAALLVTPVQHLRTALGMSLPDCPLVLCMKGLEAGTNLFPMEVARAVRPAAVCAVLTGPNFAHEIAAGLPAAAVIASEDAVLRRALMALLGTRAFRLYGSADPMGAQVGGAAKNVIAIAAGIAIGAGLGENARAAVVTRGLAEISRLAVALGGRAETVAGLSGLGDLMLTCAGAASRNYRLGLAIGAGTGPAEARRQMSAAVEGVEAAPALLVRASGVSVPVTEVLTAILAGEMNLQAAMAAVLMRPEREE
jgi:glycerol-3-phosphate dehydrogenase (NAD(P)+)